MIPGSKLLVLVLICLDILMSKKSLIFFAYKLMQIHLNDQLCVIFLSSYLCIDSRWLIIM